MATVYLAPSFGAGYQGFSAGGLPLNTGTITTYLAGGTTPKETYTTSAGSVQCANPIVLGLDGRPSTEIWLVSGFAYRFDLKDSLGNLIKTYDNLSGIGDPLIAASVFGASLMAGASATVDRALLGLADATAKGDTLSAAAAGAFTRKAVGANGSMIVADLAQTDGLLWLLQYPNSFAPNAFFQVDQLANSASSVADDNYGHDHWYVLTQTASVQVSTQTLQENGQATNARLTQNQAAAQRLGYACIIEAKEAQKLRGLTMSFKPRVRISNSQLLECAVLEWTGTADLVTSDVVLDWTNGTYTAGNFFLAANLNVLGVTAGTPSAATWTDFPINTVTIGNSCNNLILFVWTAAVAAQNVTLDIGKVRFTKGAFASDIHTPTFDETLRYACRFFEKSFLYGTAPAQSVGVTTNEQVWVTTRAGATLNLCATLPYYATKISTPTVTLFNPAVANAQVRNTSGVVDCSASSATTAGTRGFAITTTGNAGGAVGDELHVHWTASARL